jgi:hypothetical protein
MAGSQSGIDHYDPYFNGGCEAGAFLLFFPITKNSQAQKKQTRWNSG